MMRANPASGAGRSPIAGAFALIALALIRAQAAPADVIAFTGDVARDFPSTGSGVAVIDGRPGSVAQAAYITQHGWITGFQIESVRFQYDRASDTLFAGIQTYSITGDADGNGNPGYTTPEMAAAGGINYAHFGGDKSLTVAFAGVAAGGVMASPSFVAGIPASKAMADLSHTNGFTVATYNGVARGLGYSYGTILTDHVGALAVDPSASRPNFEFALTHFSRFPGFDPSRGFFVSLYLGSQRATVVGKDTIGWTLVPGPGVAQRLASPPGPVTPPSPIVPFAPPVPAPEPASVVLFLAGSAVVLAAHRRRSGRATS